jgi:hypothetical protein
MSDPLELYVYDIETFPDIFLFTGKFDGVDQFYVFEISSRINQRTELLAHLSYLQNSAVHMVGFNSLNFDWPIVQKLLDNPYTFTHQTAATMAQEIIGTHEYGQNPNHIRYTDRAIAQIDLVKINHFDNKARRTSLKTLEFAMRAPSVEDMPFGIRDLNNEEKDQLRAYNVTDVRETERFLGKCKPLIMMRKELLEKGVLSGDVLNFSDTKIGTEYLVTKIGRAKCFLKGSVPRQSIRSSVAFRDVILPKIGFRTSSFASVLEWFKAQTIWIGKDERPSLDTKLADLDFHFGVGGVHASVENRKFITDEQFVIRDIDVGAMYPSIAIVNNFHPEHLGQSFVAAYKQLQADRKQYPKGTPLNFVLKLANNGVFGNSNNMYSCFYDPKFTYSITINGQLQLLQLAELLSLIPGVQLIQGNTDGITALVPREVDGFFQTWCNEWEVMTGLKLEHAEYDRMWIRDVNNYIAIAKNGTIKRKGAYWYPITDEDYHGSSGSNWNKDFSNLSAQKGVEACLLNGYRPSDIVRCIANPFDFMLRYKTPGSAKVYIGDRPQLKTVRYYVSNSGQPMKKLASPKGVIGHFKRKNGLKDEEFNKINKEITPGTWDERIHTKNKSKYEVVETGIETGFLVKECNKASDFSWRDVNFEYYEKEIEKLMIGESNVLGT